MGREFRILQWMRRVSRVALLCSFLLPVCAAAAGRLIGAGILHPWRKALEAVQVAEADAAFAKLHATRQDFAVRAPDGIVLKGWRVRAAQPNGSWVLLFHGLSDNRVGVLGHAEFLLAAGYSVVMMDARAHGESEGTLATYGWLERNDTRAIVDAVERSERVDHLFALGESMGGAIALQSAGVEPRIEAVVAEASFANLREVTYDYAGLEISPWLGKTLFRPASILAVREAEKEGGFRFSDVSPERAAASLPFSLLLICDGGDRRIPCRHSDRILRKAVGPKQLWRVATAGHSAALGTSPEEFRRRVLDFFAPAWRR